jgi:hypothetical protein
MSFATALLRRNREDRRAAGDEDAHARKAVPFAMTLPLEQMNIQIPDMPRSHMTWRSSMLGVEANRWTANWRSTSA